VPYGLVLGALYLLLVVAVGQGMGPGHTKLAAIIDTATGTINVATILTAALATFALAGLTTGVPLAIKKVHYGQRIAFGPFILAGALIAALLAD
jgi:leader peptidase (prepilin peptidase)/N-methyltransferase